MKKPKNIDLEEDDRRQLNIMAAHADKDLQNFIQDLLSTIVEFKDFASAKWLIKQANKK